MQAGRELQSSPRRLGGGRGLGLEEGVLLEREEALLLEDLLGDPRVLVDPGHQGLQRVEVLLRPDVPAHQQPEVLPVEITLEVVKDPRLLSFIPRHEPSERARVGVCCESRQTSKRKRTNEGVRMRARA